MTSMQFAQHELGLSSNTTVDYNMYRREVCAWKLLQDPVVIGCRTSVTTAVVVFFGGGGGTAGRRVLYVYRS